MDNFDIVAKLHELMCSEAGCKDLRVSMTAKLAIYEIEKLRKERDEARREICHVFETGLFRDERMSRTAKSIATERGWDCFKEYGK
jgi:hypothetical protein